MQTYKHTHKHTHACTYKHDVTHVPSGRTFKPDSSSLPCETCTCQAGQLKVGCGGSSPGVCVACDACPAGQERLSCSLASPGNCTACLSG